MKLTDNNLKRIDKINRQIDKIIKKKHFKKCRACKKEYVTKYYHNYCTNCFDYYFVLDIMEQ